MKLQQIKNDQLSNIIYFNIVPDSYTITIKQNMRLHARMHPEKIQLDQIQNGRLSAIIYFNMPDT